MAAAAAAQEVCLVMAGRRCAAVLSVLLLCQAVSHTLAARGPEHVGVQGIPVCPVGLPACGLHGCYTPLLTKCDANNGCISAKILSQLSALVRFGSSNAETAGACPIPFVNACGDQYCGMGEICSAGVCLSSSSQQQLSTGMVGHSKAAAKAACQAARHGCSLCAGDSSEMVIVDCNQIGVAAIKGIHCFQSQLFNCAVQQGGSATFTCRGIAGVAQAVSEVFNTTINTAAAVAEQVAGAIAKEEAQLQQQHAAQAATAGSMTSQVPVVLADTVSSSSSGGRDSYGLGGGSSSISPNAWRAGANAALGTISHAVRDKGQPLLQPIFQNLANMVNNASKSLFNITTEMGTANSSKPVMGFAHATPAFNLGPAPIKDAAGALPQHTPLLLVSGTRAPAGGDGRVEGHVGSGTPSFRACATNV